MLGMDPAPVDSRVFDYDESLIDWFVSLSPAERLAELESRVAFFKQVRRDGERKLPSNPRGSRAARRRLRRRRSECCRWKR